MYIYIFVHVYIIIDIDILVYILQTTSIYFYDFLCKSIYTYILYTTMAIKHLYMGRWVSSVISDGKFTFFLRAQLLADESTLQPSLNRTVANNPIPTWSARPIFGHEKSSKWWDSKKNRLHKVYNPIRLINTPIVWWLSLEERNYCWKVYGRAHLQNLGGDSKVRQFINEKQKPNGCITIWMI